MTARTIKKKANSICLTLRSYDHQLLDAAVRQIVLTARRTGSRIVGPVPLPTRTRYFTVLRSPHVDKKSREQFELAVHKRVIRLISPSEQTMDGLMKLNISAGVRVDIK